MRLNFDFAKSLAFLKKPNNAAKIFGVTRRILPICNFFFIKK